MILRLPAFHEVAQRALDCVSNAAALTCKPCSCLLEMPYGIPRRRSRQPGVLGVLTDVVLGYQNMVGVAGGRHLLLSEPAHSQGQSLCAIFLRKVRDCPDQRA